MSQQIEKGEILLKKIQFIFNHFDSKQFMLQRNRKREQYHVTITTPSPLIE